MKNTKVSTVRWTAIIAAAFLIVYFLPRKDGREYSYEINRPWVYPLLTAPFDLPVYLDSISTQAVIDSINANFEPVFTRDHNIGKNLIGQFATRLNVARDLSLTPLEKNSLLAEVRQVYDTGIVDSDTYTKIRSGELPNVRVIHENVALSVPTSKFLSARRAYAFIDSTFHDSRFTRAISSTGLAELLVPNIVLDTLETQRLHNEVMQRAMAPIGVIQQGERIIDRGDIVTPQLYTILHTYEQMQQERGQGTTDRQFYPIIGHTLYVVLLLGAFYIYLYLFRPSYYKNPRTLTMLMLLITGTALMAFGVSNSIQGGLYLIPYAIVPVILVVFLDARTAFFAHVVTVLLATIASNFPLEFIFVQYMGGVAAINSLRDLTSRSQLLRTALFVFIAGALAYIAIELFHSADIDKVSVRMFTFLAIAAVCLSFAYVAIFLFEKIFGFISKVTLVELSDINNPVLRELSEECPGTFQHSMSVSNLASAAAHRIGANVQLVRAGALYHDIGKIDNPAFFTENQHGVNPHDALDPRQSARIVIAHVSDGVKRADKAKLPESIKDFIREHHGAGKAKYFYNTWCNMHPDEVTDPAPFTYPGPNPRCKETSILMMADSVEAASRSLKSHTPEEITTLVNKIIDSQIADGLHADSPLSFHDIKEIKETFSARLRTMYHARISYPEIIKHENSPKT